MTSRARMVQEEIVEKNLRLLVLCIEMKNSCLIFLSETEDRLGTLAVSLPPVSRLVSSTSLSSILLGNRNTLSARLLAERLAARMNKIVLVSVHLRTIGEREAIPILLKLVEKCLKNIEVKES